MARKLSLLSLFSMGCFLAAAALSLSNSRFDWPFFWLLYSVLMVVGIVGGVVVPIVVWVRNNWEA